MGRKAITAIILVVIIALVLFFLLSDFVLRNNEPTQITVPEGDIATAISEGRPVSCVLTVDLGMLSDNPDVQGIKASSNVSIEGTRFRVEGRSGGFPFTMISDGSAVYINSPVLGESWYKVPANLSEKALARPDEIRKRMNSLREGIVLDCQITDDIPDSEFTLPAGVVIKSFDEIAGLVDPSILE